MRKALNFVLEWWLLILIVAVVLMSLLSGGAPQSRSAQTPEEIRQEIRDDAWQAYEEQSYRGH